MSPGIKAQILLLIINYSASQVTKHKSMLVGKDTTDIIACELLVDSCKVEYRRRRYNE